MAKPTRKTVNQLPFEKQPRKRFVKKDAPTSDAFGKKPEERTVNELLDSGMVIVDKPSGPNSHQVSAYVKQMFTITKSGHSGTLDPHVTGVLPVALGRGTRIVDALLSAGKEYVALMHLHKPVAKAKIEQVFVQFKGRIKQLPPVRSAVKRQQRYRTIYYIELLDFQDQDVVFRVGCQAGTYIRKLIHDMGEALGVGAHMLELRRTQAGPFKEHQAVILQDLKDALVFYQQGKEEYLKKHLLPIEAGVQHLAKIWVFDTTVDSICHGASLKVPGVSQLESFDVDETVAIMTLKNELVATATTRMNAKEVMKKQKGVVVKLAQVFMKPRTYPRVEK